jgi:pyridoxamine 5'-phosphate oxidase
MGEAVGCAAVDVRARPLLESDLDPDPLRQFERWFEEAAGAVRAPEAMALATATADGAPSVRMVLLKRFDADGLVFHTNYESRKGLELEANPRAAALLYWDPLGRQVRVEGPVERAGRAESEVYFRTRPRAAQVGAAVSRQSRPIGSRDELEARRDAVERELDGRDVPQPDWWGGYVLRPESWEFWQHREDRFHDRLRYRRGENGGWQIERLQP